MRPDGPGGLRALAGAPRDDLAPAGGEPAGEGAATAGIDADAEPDGRDG
jgi:hypothetical protein